MQTLADIEQAEQATRERAWRYGQLTSERDRLTKTIERLTVSDGQTPSALAQIQKLAAQVDPSLTTRGAGFIPGGYLVRDLLVQVATDALASTTLKSDKRMTALADARRALESVEAALEAFKE